MRIIADREIPQAGSAFSAFGDVELVDGRNLTRGSLGDAEILLVRSVTRVDRALLDGSNIRFVGTATSGVDHLDMDYLDGRGISYFDAAGCNARAVSEYVLACGFLRGPLSSRRTASIQAGVIGYGHVGKIVCSMLTALGIRCVINDPPLAESDPDDRFVGLDEALASDIVTLHVPYTEVGRHPTRGLIGLRQLRRINPGALLINAARGGVIDEGALVTLLQERTEARVVVDCWAGEPTVDLALLRLAALATPHIAGHTVQARLRATAMLTDALTVNLGVTTWWRPPSADTVELQLQPQATDVLRGAVLKCCDPRVATAAMRRMLGLPGARRANRFDALRQDAATRCEFTNYRIASEGLQSDTVAELCALGFETTTDGTVDGSPSLP